MTAQSKQVSTTDGTVKGFVREGTARWRSIPYARPPMGALRFRAPEPPQPWRGVRYCTDFGNCAPQDPRYTLLGTSGHQPMSEDCLTLNVVAPADRSDRPLPVMFFVHGGGYMFGSSATPVYDGAALARRGCVYVSVNYRLGALGCLDLSSLSTAEHTIDANVFLRDLVMALRWVRDNVAQFGGDPANVTIFGESAGAHAVATLLAVPEAKGLFHQAISESPPGGLIRTPDVAAEQARRFVDIIGADPADAARAVMTARPSQLVRTLEQLMAETIRETPDTFGIGATSGAAYLPLDPIDAMRRAKAHPVPLIIGNNAMEASLFARFMDYLPTNQPVIDRLLADVEPAAAQRMRCAYPGYPNREACLTFGSDFTFGSVAWQIAEAHGSHVPTYLYRYDYTPRTLAWVGLGATHATELLAVFDIYATKVGSIFTVAGDRRSARRVSRDLQRRWRAFSQRGTPGEDWPRYTDTDRATMIFDRHSRVERDPTPLRRQAWAHLGDAVESPTVDLPVTCDGGLL
jgi:para-nitrobenzyl esterase